MPLTPNLPKKAMAAAAAIATLLLLAACGDDNEGGQPSGSASGDWPVTIAHKFGETEIPKAPERVVAVGFNDQDFVLSLGVKPVGIRQFQGGIDITKRPWAQEQLAGSQPKIVGAEEIKAEQVAALNPDLILGIYSGMTQRQYDTLSQIAPTVAQSKEYIDYGMPWEQQLKVTGEALGRADEAAKVEKQVTGEFAAARKQHPEFADKTLVFAAATPDGYAVYSTQDLRARFFEQLGFKPSQEVEKLAGDTFFAQVSSEQLRLLDEDVLVIYGEQAQLEKDKLFKRLDVVRRGAVVYMATDDDFANALGFSSPLSLPFAIDQAVPQLTKAVGG